MKTYIDALRCWRFGVFWGGLTLSYMGDGLTRLALVWLTYHLHNSAADVGLLVTAYGAPVVLGGPLAGVVLDRIGARRAMLLDNLIRGALVASVPILYHLHALASWHLYLVAATYGFLKMLSLAGAPTLVPSLLPAEHVNAANALEMLTFSLSDVVGPALSGLLLMFMHAADVLVLDAATYVAFILSLLAIGPVTAMRGTANPTTGGLAPAVRFVVGNRFIRNTTLMYMLLNVGHALMEVLIPAVILGGRSDGSEALGMVTGAIAVGGMLGSLLCGGVRWRWPYHRLIAWCLVLSGLPLLPLLGLHGEVAVGLAMALSSFIQAPLTIWAQTERMRLIPTELRGRVFALLRTFMQSGPALGGLIASKVVGVLAMPAVVALSITLISGPGAVAVLSPALLDGERRAASEHDA